MDTVTSAHARGTRAGTLTGGGEAPAIEVAVGYSNANPSPVLKLFRSRLDELVGLQR